MMILRELIFLCCVWCVSSQTNATTEMSNTTPPPITELVTIMETTNITTQALSITTINGTVTLMTSSQPTTAGASTSSAATSSVAMETSALQSTQRSTTKVGTTYLTTKKKKKPAGLSSGVIALIAVIAVILVVLVLAAIAYLCRKRSLAQKMKRRFTNREPKLSIHRPESGLILDENRTLNSFNTDRNLDTICHENSVFLNDKDGITEVQVNGANNKATLPSTASLKVANETVEDPEVPSNDTTGQNGDLRPETAAANSENVQADDINAEPVQSDDVVNSETVNETDDINAATVKTDDASGETVKNNDVATDIVTNDDTRNEGLQTESTGEQNNVNGENFSPPPPPAAEELSPPPELGPEQNALQEVSEEIKM